MKSTKNVLLLKIGLMIIALGLIVGSWNCGSQKTKNEANAETSSSNAQVEPAPEYKPEITSTGEWAQWRGPNRDGRSQETGLLKSWPESGPKELWRVQLGAAFSGISITADGFVYTMFASEDKSYVICLSAADGSEVWRFLAGNMYPDRQGGDGPRCTPTVDQGKVYVFNAYGKVYALDAKSGEQVWAADLSTKLGARVPQWGFSSSLLIEGDMLFAEGGGKDGKALAAFNKLTGEILWASQDDIAGYSSPIAVTVGGIRQVIFFTGTKIMSVSPEDGHLFWEEPWKTDYDVNAATPVFVPPDNVFIASGYGVGGGLFQMKAENGSVSVTKKWHNDKMRNQMCTSVLHGNYLYGFDEKKLVCVSVASGEQQWEQRGFGKGSLMYADGHLIALGDEGTLGLIEANPTEYREKGRADILSELCWTMPSLAAGKLYARDIKELVCLDLTSP